MLVLSFPLEQQTVSHVWLTRRESCGRTADELMKTVRTTGPRTGCPTRAWGVRSRPAGLERKRSDARSAPVGDRHCDAASPERISLRLQVPAETGRERKPR